MSGLSPRAITVAIMAMGGEGGGVLADWIVDLAESGGYLAQTTSVPGVAQRTGSTIYYVELFPEEAARAAGKDPVLALMPVPGELDIVIASELMEAGRAVQRGLVTPDRTTLIASTHRVYSIAERSAVGDARVDSGKLLEAGEAAAKRFVRGDFARIAADAHSVISAPLFGALAATGALPFGREQFEEAVRRGGVGVEGSLAAFAEGWRVVGEDTLAPAPAESRRQPEGLPRFPPESHAILANGVERLTDYQDARYAGEYLDRLAAIRDADAQYGPGDFALLRETGRYLALWMSYEDAIRVAGLKIRRSRFERVRSEARAGPGDVLRIHEFLHPGAAEIADVLPEPLGRWLLKTGWARAFVERLARHGKVVETTSVSGYLQLYVVACLRRWRRRSLRFARENGRIGGWLESVAAFAGENYALACEVAECPRLLKGYGDTHFRGNRSFELLMEALPRLRHSADAAPRLRKLREAALADDTGEKLAEALRLVHV